MNNPKKQSAGRFGLWAGALLLAGVARGDGIPEPGLVMYGVVRNLAAGNYHLLAHGASFANVTVCLAPRNAESNSHRRRCLRRRTAFLEQFQGGIDALCMFWCG